MTQVTQQSDGNALLMGGGTRWAKFPAIGSTVTGKILTEPEKRQQRDFDDPSVLLSWPNGDPKWEIVVDIATDERDPEDEDDDGRRALHIKGYMQNAVREAVRAARADGLHIGGTITVQYIGDGEVKGRGKPPKMYAARYVPPMSSGNGSLMGADVPPTMPANVPQPLPQPTPTPTPVPQPAPPGVDAAMWAGMSADQRSTFRAAMSDAASQQPAATPPPSGVDPALWSNMHAEQQRAVLAAMGVPF